METITQKKEPSPIQKVIDGIEAIANMPNRMDRISQSYDRIAEIPLDERELLIALYVTLNEALEKHSHHEHVQESKVARYATLESPTEYKYGDYVSDKDFGECCFDYDEVHEAVTALAQKMEERKLEQLNGLL